MVERIPQATIKEVVARSDIIDIVQSRIAIKKKGANYQACCPFHDEKTPSFTVSESKQFYYCFGCGAHGNAISFVMDYDQMPFLDAVQYLAERVGITLELEADNTEDTKPLYIILKRAAALYQSKLKGSLPAIDYLKSRQLNGNIAKHFLIGYAPAGWNSLSAVFPKTPTNELVRAGLLIEKNPQSSYDRFRDRIIFPIRDTRGRVIGLGGRALDDSTPKYLNSPETPIFHKSEELYGLYEAKQANRNLEKLIIVEGYMDVISLHLHGITTAVATLGTATNLGHVKKCLRYTSDIIFCFDGDRAGRQAAWKAITMNLALLRDGVQLRFLFLPDGEDPDSLVQSQGPDVFNAMMSEASPLSTVFFETLDQLHPLQSLDAKANYAKEAMTHIDKMPEGIFKQLMTQQLNERLGIIKTEANPPKPTTSQAQPSKQDQFRHSPIQHACTLLLHNPELVEEVDELNWLDKVNIRGKHLLVKLVNFYQAHPKMTIGELLLTWENDKEKAWISQQTAQPLAIPADGRQEEFRDCLKRLKEIGRKQSLEALIEKSKRTSLSIEEKQSLQALLNQKFE